MIRRVVAPRTTPLPDPAPGPWSVPDAFAFCEQLARDHSENYPLASRFIPEPLRPHIWALYAFARSADDFADEPDHAGRRHQALTEWEDRLNAVYHGEADHPIFVALRETVERKSIPISPLRDLLTAFRMDLAVRRYPTYESVRKYCAYSAHPVGRLVLHVFDQHDPSLHRYSDDLCAALQLTHFLQDLDADYRRGRVYFPVEDLSHFGVREEDIAARRMTPRLRDLVRFQVARARALFERGRPIADQVGGDLGFALYMAWHGGMTILDKAEASHDLFQRRPMLNRADRISMIARSAARRWPSFVRRG